MARDRHEQRFVDFTRFVLPGREVGQELSIPRKARRLDAVFHVGQAPGLMGPIRPRLHERAVIFEHESGQVRDVAMHRALLGHTWMCWRHAVMRTGESRWGTPTEGDMWLRGTAHTPTVVVVADELHGEPRAAFPQLSQRWPGVWCGRDPLQGGLVVLDIARLPEQGGWSYWRLTSAGLTAKERERRVEALRTDRHLPKTERVALTEAIAMRMIPTTPEEKNAALRQLRKEAWRLGAAEGKAEGEAEGRRALLRVAGMIAPDAVPRLERMEDLVDLERAVLKLIQERHA